MWVLRYIYKELIWERWKVNYYLFRGKNIQDFLN